MYVDMFIISVPSVPADMPLYDILNEFQKGSSHMAAVVKAKGKGKTRPLTFNGEKFEENKVTDENSQLTTSLLSKQDENSDSVVVEIDRPSRPTYMNRPLSLPHNDGATKNLSHFSEDIEDGEVIGIITLEDVFEELLQVMCVPHLSIPFQSHSFLQLPQDFKSDDLINQCRRRL